MNGGADLLRAGLERHLVLALPPVLSSLEAARRLGAGTLELPKMSGPTEVRLLAVGEYPACMVAVTDVPALIESIGNEGDDGERDRRVTYTCRVFFFVRGRDRRVVADLRDAYAFAGRACLAGRPAFLGGLVATSPLPSYREAFSSIDKTREGSVAGVYAELSLKVDERW